MTRYDNTPVIISGGLPVKTPLVNTEGRAKTLAYSIFDAHNRAENGKIYKISFDTLVSHDITYVGIIQAARASGMKTFPKRYVLTNCHNSLCAVGGTINADDHTFGLSAAIKYGGVYVPPNTAVIHQYARESLTKCGGMILGSDSHTRFGCFGTLGVGEGGGELTKQLLGDTWDIEPPRTVLVWLEGTPRRGVGPHDAALALVAETFKEGRVKNAVLEFAGPGVAGLSAEFRAGIDVMTTETGCLTSIWETDEVIRGFYESVGRPEDFTELRIPDGAAYDAMVGIDLSRAECMIALPFHPSKAVAIHELQDNPSLLEEAELEHLLRDGKLIAEQGVIVGCAGGLYENIAEAAAIMDGHDTGSGYFEMSVYPSSAPVSLAVTKDGIASRLMESGAVMKSAFCGPCFGAGDTPANGAVSIRHATRNFPSREGSKPDKGQISYVFLMDARSIAATARNHGALTAATDVEYEIPEFTYKYDGGIYGKRVYDGYGRPEPESELRFGPNIADWPKMPSLETNLLVKLCAVIDDEVTTTDELIPSGETSSYRSNPTALAEFTLSRRCPDYVSRSKAVKAMEDLRRTGKPAEEAASILKRVGASAEDTTIGSCVFAVKPGDGSAREQAASCQKVLGGFANIAHEYATKRYRSNCISWGLVPFTIASGEADFKDGDWVYVPDVRRGLLEGDEAFEAILAGSDGISNITLKCGSLTQEEREILTSGCLMNYYSNNR